MIRLVFVILLPAVAFGQSIYKKGDDKPIKAYTQAIAEYIKAEYKNEKVVFDTLFIGKHEEFPEIELPAVIEKTKIMIVTPEEAEKKLKYLNTPRKPRLMEILSQNQNFFHCGFVASAI